MNFVVSGVAKDTGTSFGEISPCLLVPSGPLESGGVEVGYFVVKDTDLVCSPDSTFFARAWRRARVLLRKKSRKAHSRVRMFPLWLPLEVA
jgi:hypothetical protein